LALVVLVSSLGLADSLNPSTLAPALVFATGRGACGRLAAFSLGVFAVSLAGGLVLALGPGQILLDAIPHPAPHTKRVFEVAGGILLLILAAVTWIGRERIARRIATSAAERRPPRGSASAFALGAGIMAVELPTALPYFAAIAAVVGSGAAIGVRAALVLLYNAAFIAPLVAILAIRSLAGEGATSTLESLRAWLRRRAPMLLAALLGALGAACVGIGVAGLI
jgi:cytochrome c biogenesis protein CcdA